MKKLPVVLCACIALAGCRTFDPDLDREADRRASERAAYHQEFGCTFTGDHDSYRQCILETRYNNGPKTVRLTQDDQKRSVAIVKNEMTQSYDPATETYKTERVIVIETEEKLVPMPASVLAQQPAPATPVVKKTVEKSCEDIPPEAQMALWKEMGAPVAEPEPAEFLTETVVVEPAPKETWWDSYQKEKPAKEAAVQCPCEDPNEPCPQCVEK